LSYIFIENIWFNGLLIEHNLNNFFFLYFIIGSADILKYFLDTSKLINIYIFEMYKGTILTEKIIENCDYLTREDEEINDECKILLVLIKIIVN
jgi:hypothetical protein